MHNSSTTDEKMGRSKNLFCVSKRVSEFLHVLNLMRQFYDAEIQYYIRKIGSFKKMCAFFIT